MPSLPQFFWFRSLSSLGQQFSLPQVWTHLSMRVFNQGAGEIQMLNDNCDAEAVYIPFSNYVFSFWNLYRISLPWRTASQIQIHLVKKVKSKRQLLVNQEKFADLRKFVLISTTAGTSPIILEVWIRRNTCISLVQCQWKGLFCLSLGTEGICWNKKLHGLVCIWGLLGG